MKPSARKFPGAGFVIFVRNVYLYPAKIKKNMTKLSVNINKIATLRNSRGGDIPNVVEAALNAERFGAQGITVHPRPDQRHIRYQDVRDLKQVITTELNMEGNPIDSFIDLALEVLPAQVTLVPDAHDALTSNSGWDTKAHQKFLSEVIATFKAKGIRTSIFVDPDPEMIRYAAETGADRVELYTESYASGYAAGREKAIAPFVATAEEAVKYGLGVNGGHDLSLENLHYFARTIPNLLEVSIGHALISNAIYLGLENTIQLYLRQLKE
jgi:pyridoxine 5-phosphate synthase